MKILQINTNNRKVSYDLSIALAKKESADFILISEVNQTVLARGATNLYHNGYNCAILKINKSIPIIKHYSSTFFTCVETINYIIFSVYISPNIPVDEFVGYLNELEECVRRNVHDGRYTKDVLIGGDFNAKNPWWGGEKLDARGSQLQEFASSNELDFLNVGNTPTCVRHNGVSYIDITIANESVINKSPTWIVKEDVSLSDHNFITIDIPYNNNSQAHTKKMYKKGVTNMRAFNTMFSNLIETDEINANNCIRHLKEAYNANTPLIECDKNNNPPYWWDAEIESLVMDAKKLRRIYQRNRRSDLEELSWINYKESKKTLAKAIRKSKKRAWHNLCAKLDSDCFGDSYKIVTQQLKLKPPKIEITNENKIKVFNDLFITGTSQPIQTHEKIRPDNQAVSVTKEDILAACDKLKSGKAPGPDGIPPSVVKEAVKQNLDYFQTLFSLLLSNGQFPTLWKKTKLILIEKPKKANQSNTNYRPICLIDALGKLFENVINSKLHLSIELNNKGFHRSQYGFVKGKSTLDALTFTINEIKTSLKKGRWTAIALLDVKNAFNSAPWDLIIQKMSNMNIDRYLIDIVKSYLNDRTVEISRGTIARICGGFHKAQC